MHQESQLSIVKDLRIDYYGCAFQETLYEETTRMLSPLGIKPVTKGQVTPAAGVALSADIIVAIAQEVAGNLIVEALKAVISCVKKAAISAVNRNCCVSRVRIESDSCDYVIRTNGSAGYSDEHLNYNALIEKMIQLHDTEQASGRTIIRIESPCELIHNGNSFDIRNVGIGCYSLWLVDYQDGERRSHCLYDAENESFISLSDDASLTEISGIEDTFYNHSELKNSLFSNPC